MILDKMIDATINKHLHAYEHDFSRRDRVKRWHWNRVAYDRGPVFWCLAYVWCYRPFYLLWQLRCKNVCRTG